MERAPIFENEADRLAEFEQYSLSSAGPIHIRLGVPHSSDNI
jgi:hypothetical protein